MIEKCQRKRAPSNSRISNEKIRDSVGIRVVCNFIDDIYTCIDLIQDWDDVAIVKQKTTLPMPSPTVTVLTT